MRWFYDLNEFHKRILISNGASTYRRLAANSKTGCLMLDFGLKVVDLKRNTYSLLEMFFA